ncbi:MAG: pentapeptide repeat-containing protein, partial [Chloroflexi bacterium]
MNKSVLVAIIFFTFIGFVLFADVLIPEPSTTEAPACLPNCAGQDLSGKKLSGEDLRGVDFSNSDLHFADLNRADLRGANLSGADLRFANLRGVRIDPQTQLDDKWRLVWDIVN